MLVQINPNFVINTDRIEVITKLSDNQIRVRIGGEFHHFHVKLDDFMNLIQPTETKK